jgi:exopolyphosphatase / guanosine-5'-triphosphate,3'-diphosphate pyrophosphatase
MNSSRCTAWATAERELIEYGALLHDIGWHIGRQSHHKHSMYLILNGDLKNFTPEEISIIAHIARYHRRAAPKSKHETATPAPRPRPADRGCRRGPAAIGRRPGPQPFQRDSGFALKIDDKSVRSILSARSDAELEIWGARRKMKWFSKVFKIRSFRLSWPSGSTIGESSFERSCQGSKRTRS